MIRDIFIIKKFEVLSGCRWCSLIADLVAGVGLDMNNHSDLALRDVASTKYHRQTHIAQADPRHKFLPSQHPILNH